jgi:hypothetical protein
MNCFKARLAWWTRLKRIAGWRCRRNITRNFPAPSCPMKSLSCDLGAVNLDVGDDTSILNQLDQVLTTGPAHILPKNKPTTSLPIKPSSVSTNIPGISRRDDVKGGEEYPPLRNMVSSPLFALQHFFREAVNRLMRLPY